jgi:hypothetical protein
MQISTKIKNYTIHHLKSAQKTNLAHDLFWHSCMPRAPGHVVGLGQESARPPRPVKQSAQSCVFNLIQYLRGIPVGAHKMSNSCTNMLSKYIK